MSQSIRDINIALELFGCIMALIIVVNLFLSENRKSKLNMLFIWIMLFQITTLGGNAIAGIFRGGEGVLAFYMVRIANFIAFCSSYLIAAVFAHYIYQYINERISISKIFPRIITIACIISILLCILSQFNHMYYYIDEFNLYQRREWFWLSQVFGIICLIINAIVVISYRKVLQLREYLLLLTYVLLPMLALVIQIFSYGLAMLHIAIMVSTLIIFVGIQVEVDKNVIERTRRELNEAQIAVMLSQIKPHFLYNSLVVIEQLCYIDPTMAAETVVEFSEYLRGNLDSLSNIKPVEFERELKHTEVYLAIEKKRFGNKLNIVYDIEYKDFEIPVMTLQSIVENAVKHGITQRVRGGTITIKTRKEDGGAVISVIDDGIGFNPELPIEDGRSRVGIKNVKTRLLAICGGSLEIESLPDKGTTATIRIPAGGEIDDYNCC